MNMKIASFLWHFLIIAFNCKIVFNCIIILPSQHKPLNLFTALVLTYAIGFAVIVIGQSIKKIINLK